MRFAISAMATNGSLPGSEKSEDSAEERDILMDLRSLRRSFQALDTHPRIYLGRIPTVIEPNKYKISEKVSVIIRQRIDALGKELGLTVIPMDQAYGGDLSVLGDDHVHGDARGALELAQTVAKALTSKAPAPTPTAP